jgi:hypothetical protein
MLVGHILFAGNSTFCYTWLPLCSVTLSWKRQFYETPDPCNEQQFLVRGNRLILSYFAEGLTDGYRIAINDGVNGCEWPSL